MLPAPRLLFPAPQPGEAAPKGELLKDGPNKIPAVSKSLISVLADSNATEPVLFHFIVA